MNSVEFDDMYLAFYFMPLFISISLSIIIDGSFPSFAYGITLYGIQARLIGFGILILCIIVLYHVFYKIPQKTSNIKKVKQINLMLLKSMFFYVFILTICSKTFLIIFVKNLALHLVIYFSMLLICFIFQLQFVKRMKAILFTNGDM